MNKNLTIAAILFLANILLNCPLYAADGPVQNDPSTGDHNEQECAHVANLQPPKSDLPDAQLIKSSSYCNAEDMYYDTKADYYDTKADPAASNKAWEKVRACAFSTGDNAVLMMLYANGFGVKVNPDLAAKFACGDEWDEREIADQVAGLMALKKSTGGQRNVFDQCDSSFLTMSENICASLAEHQKDHARNHKLDEISRKMSPEQARAFDNLRKAETAFVAAHSDEVYEDNIDGTMRAQFGIDARMDEDNQFLSDAEQCEKGVFPVYTRAQFAGLDKNLNQVYRKTMRYLHSQAGDARMEELVRDAQRIWLKYRDAWVAFGHARYPSVPAYAWQARLTERRIHQLKN